MDLAEAGLVPSYDDFAPLVGEAGGGRARMVMQLKAMEQLQAQQLADQWFTMQVGRGLFYRCMV